MRNIKEREEMKEILRSVMEEREEEGNMWKMKRKVLMKIENDIKDEEMEDIEEEEDEKKMEGIIV